MFTQQLPASVFEHQRAFIAAMGGKLDFVWAAKVLVKEETKELKEAYEKTEISDSNMADIFKEVADVIYVVAHFYNVMPLYAPELVSDKINQQLQDILDDAATIVSTVTQKLHIPLPLILAAFDVVHNSNMSKLDEDGKPVYREDGKVMKGPNYVAPDMMPVVKLWKEFQVALEAGEVTNDTPVN